MNMETGVCVLHLFCSPRENASASALRQVIESATAGGCQVMTAAMLGHRCDIAVMALSADIAALKALQTGLQRAGLDVRDSYISITEVSEYAKGLPAEALQDRLYPVLPPEGKPAFCFYPMSKKRDGHANWYATPFEERTAMMMEHGKSGRTFAGKIVQLVTASTGLDTHEWGVTLFGVTLEVIKDVVYTMRFDKGSALYGEFGNFYVGYLADIETII
jgi:peroxiredoxin